MIQESTPTFFQRWGDFASVAGLIVSVIGFAFTIWGILRAKNAAQRAKEEARKVGETISKFDTMMELSEVITIMEEVKRLHRINAWVILPDRYSVLKRKLITIRSASSDISDEHRASLQGVIQNINEIEKKVERVLFTPDSSPNVVQMNEIVSEQLDTVNETLASLRQVIRMENHG